MVRNACIDDGHHNARRAGRDVPGRRRVDAVVTRAGGEIVPLVDVLRIVRRQHRHHDGVRLSVFDFGQRAHTISDRLHLGQRHARRQAHHVRVTRHFALIRQLNAGCITQTLHLRRTRRGKGILLRDKGPILDDDLIGRQRKSGGIRADQPAGNRLRSVRTARGRRRRCRIAGQDPREQQEANQRQHEGQDAGLRLTTSRTVHLLPPMMCDCAVGPPQGARNPCSALAIIGNNCRSERVDPMPRVFGVKPAKNLSHIERDPSLEACRTVRHAMDPLTAKP